MSSLASGALVALAFGSLIASRLGLTGLQEAPSETTAWHLLANSHPNETIYYSLPPTVAESEEPPIFWFRVELLLPEENIHGVVTVHEADCVRRRTREIQMTAYNEANLTGDSETWTNAQPWQFAVPDSNMSNVLDVVCKR